jgi:hypothetical protein
VLRSRSIASSTERRCFAANPLRVGAQSEPGPDIDQLEVILVPEQDDRVNPAGIKGLGELGNVGTAAAIANAVYHATGQRIRDLPIKLDRLHI